MAVLTGVALTFFAAAVPALLWALFIWWIDRYEREPFYLIVITFVWGAVPAVILSLAVELLTGWSLHSIVDESSLSLIEAGVVAPVVEEMAKGLALLGIFRLARRDFDGVLDGVVYGALVGFGFAMTENFFYFLGAYFDGGVGSFGTVFFLRSILFGLNHAFFSALTGAGVGLARWQSSRRRRILLMALGLLAAIVFHMVHNVGASLAGDDNLTPFFVIVASNWLGVLVILLIITLEWRQERRVIMQELADEVDTLLTWDEYRSAMAPARRVRDWWRGGAARRRSHLHHLLTRLAFKKHRLRRLGPQSEPRLTGDIEGLRAAIVALRADGG